MWINVFDPEYKNLDCPQCHLCRIYFDREIGYYCMSCGTQISYDQIVMLIEIASRTSQPRRRSGKSEKQPPVEVKELPPSKKKSKPARHDATKHDKSQPSS
ncbi:MAG: hypothetical protein A2Z25_12305 [Planctomycetes bacterium RBG_16_55_9]|nr:MAG: hypothetical protein A2Z25_12305 [Planctomycetes bacterium RBG_16_55_9]